jgi:hypothetical protein
MRISKTLFRLIQRQKLKKKMPLSRTATLLFVAQAVGRVGERGFEGLDADGEQG